MELDQAIDLLKTTVKNNGTNDTKHLDFGLVPTSDRKQYERALMIVKMAILEGKMNQDEFETRVHLKD